MSLQHVLIASADKDLLALVSDSVEVHSTRTGNRMGPAEVREKLGVDPCQVVDYLTLVGDASDNIRGAKGIGPKTAAASARQSSATWTTCTYPSMTARPG